MWVRRFGLNRVGIWQGNCFMEIHCSAAFHTDSETDMCGKVLIVDLALVACSIQIALLNHTSFRLPAKRV